ncbi:MAG TPA: TonB-dependent receptor [Steroidobacteraceae bacterium]|nr:TonB-dependent receptor [Steroidobacteraceae bacterium]
MKAIVKHRTRSQASRWGSAGGAGARSKVGLAVAVALYGAAAVRTGAALADAAAADATQTVQSPALQEVVVTARKREENLQEVPESIDVFTSKDLQNMAIAQFEDYATKTPSVSFISIGPGTQEFFMRGVSDGSNPNVPNTSTTGFFLDDMSMSYYGSIPDLHAYDIARIEVLNGPQGTLFGAGAMSGAIRLITNKPDPYAFSAGLDVDGGKIDDASYNTTYEGFLNIPLVDGWTAVRLSTYALHDGGFIDNLLTTRDWVNGVVSNNAAWARNDYNTQNVDGARAAIKQKIADDWSAVLTYSYQSQRHTGAWDQDPQHYALDEVSRFAPENGNNYLSAFDLHVDGDVGIGDLVYAGTYWDMPLHTVDEYSNYVQYSNVSPFNAPDIQSFACLTGPTIEQTNQGVPLSQQSPFSGCKVPEMYYVYDSDTKRWSNELRLQSKAGGRWHWLGGLYWEKTDENYSLFYDMPNIQQTGEAFQSQISYYNVYAGEHATPLPQEWYSYVSRFDYLQVTEFTDETFDIFDWWSVEAGVQHFQSHFTGSSDWAGYAWQPKEPSSYSGASHKFNAKVGTNFKITKDLLVYAIFSQGFRDGGINPGIGTSCQANGAPIYYKPDTLNNFEVGWKSTLLGGRMTWNGALYYMPWKDYQTPVFDLAICPTSFNANIGNARIYGVESNVDYLVTDHLSLEASLSYNDSKLTSDSYYNPNYIVYAGERLPYVPYFDYSANARYERPVSPTLNGFFQYDVSHKGDMWSSLQAVDEQGFARSLQPAYEISDLRLGIESASSEWSTELYISNLWNTNAVIFTNTGNYDHRQTTNEPRVFGIRLKYRWGK